MDPDKLTSNIIFNYDLKGFNKKALNSVSEVLNYIDLITERGGQDPLILTIENLYYEKIIESLRKGIEELGDEERSRLSLKLDEMSGGIYDLESINFRSPDSALIIGKIFSAQKSYQKRYGGVFGIVNTEANTMLNNYDRIAECFYADFPFIPGDKKESFNENKSEINCIDVLRFAGDFNLTYKPISLFYTGTKSKQIPAQSKVALFTNIYFKRFELISEQLGRKFINDFYDNENVSREDINKTLIYWLRGHDLGHFFGQDKLGENMKDVMNINMQDNRRIYYILNELKSDIISLYIFKSRLNELLGNFDIKYVFQVFISELFRYMRRGSFLHYADGGSAYLAYKYFIKSGAVTVNKHYIHDIDYEKMSNDIEKLCKKLIALFKNGNNLKVLAFINKLADFENLTSKELPEELEFLDDFSIPLNISINNEPGI
ncbi:MAG: hypothetical protein ACR2NW_08630 [Thermodesulfobacteriota bacterium]